MTLTRPRIVVTVALLIAGARIAHVQQIPQPAAERAARAEKSESYSPLGFEDLRAYEQAYPGVPGSAAVVRASTGRYWVFRGIAYRGSVAQGAVWNSLGPLSMGDGGASGAGSRSDRPAWRRVQATQLTVCLPGTRQAGPRAAGSRTT